MTVSLVLLVLLLLTTLADYASTVYFLKNTKLREGNLFLKKIIDKFGNKGLLLAKLASVGVIAALNVPAYILAGLAAMYAGVVVWNVKKIKEAQRG
jgi:hypothetical protein